MITVGTFRGAEGKTYRETSTGGRWAKVMVSESHNRTKYISVAKGNNGEYTAWEVVSMTKQKDAASAAEQWVKFGWM